MIDDVRDIAGFYDADPRREDERLVQHQLEHDLTWRYLERYLPTAGRILELGAATGRYSIELAMRGGTADRQARRLWCLALLFIVGCQGTDADANRSILAIESSPVDMTETLAAYDLTTPVFAPGTADSTPPSLPRGIALEHAALIFADVQAHRFYRLQLDNSTLASFGREGTGPGELLAPVGVTMVDGDYYVLDGRNARVSRYAMSGEFLDSRTLESAAGAFAVLDDGTAVVPAPGPDDMVQFVAPDGARRLSDPWPGDASTDSEATRTFRSAMTLVVRTPDDHVHAFDPTRGVLVRISPAGRALAVRHLPEDYLRVVREELDAKADGFPTPPLFTPLASIFSAGPDGVLFLGTKTHSGLGLVIDPVTYRARVVMRPNDVPEPILAVLFARDRAYILTDSRVLVRRWAAGVRANVRG